jgi:elongation factor Tu
MDKLCKITADIHVNIDGRKSPFFSGYRPGFSFSGNMQTSGHIELINKKELYPGQSAIVNIYFFSDQLLGNIMPNTEFKFFEANIEIGFGKVIKVFGWEKEEDDKNMN